MNSGPSDCGDDIDRIMEVMARAFAPEFGEAWNRRQVSDSLLLAGTGYCLIGVEGSLNPQPEEKVAGFALTRAIFDEEELLLFAVLPEHRGKGLGAALLTEVIARARSRGIRRLFLEMRRNNPAGKMYTGFGFRTIGIRPGYYRTASGDRLDALSQELHLVDN
ncbi:GNAT family N-acetyltransferase [Novosphingobium sp.]|uniref:GNAT family N-acetyltransferase n=1 Tax=Novosphingobium sp. TaxID=1874826 RepID=UPI00261FEEF7|nr:GNAT family N-acetyltransferase [Novosphingobium sp.]